ncbi:DNA-binding transcriptional regulator, PadR family [Kaistia soli DSM 19436]|uniref:DNA-binding transcriptional regulator, PadR family n=1 Tax=Kaistia soli DSM 19436 TaxID=1122133 RepID=A0A1M5AHR3_9HYPH|nr:PadR family transcriptional regulator [Kaistia soli]SHF29753.1 DNA-binding transcriptional regulator, PadR family [Kaistia soli DSM 19436]
MGHFHHHGRHGHGCRPAGFEGVLSFMSRRGGPGHGGPFGGRGPMGGRGGDGFRMGRMVADGDLRLIVLSLLEKQPRHGYDIIKAIEELTSGSYSPSPGVIYPTLTFLEEGGHVSSVSETNKKVYSITDAGLAHLTANRAGVNAVLDHLARIGRRLAEARAWFDREEDDRRGQPRDRDIEGVVPELNDARRMLKAAIAAAIGAPEDEQRRIADILAKAAAAIKAQPDDPVDL